ncbi:serine hydrolase domain-containing protein [Catenovulum agarivorans]|uniref:serine hydrolase domain-containing protein n=1 Tax=Catenovulum agarivorans TaxID=1172192 RepID=UPI0003702944|nr:serine hydrolase domain-containing protein [Catenovulum agarivorans]
MLKYFSVVISFCLLSSCASHAEINSNYEQVLTKNFSKTGAGVVAAVYKNGQPVFKQAYGMANVDKQIQMNTDAQFRIGSLTKQFTAAAIMLLQEQGKLSVKDPINQHLGKYQNPLWQDVSIEHLLTHSSGIAEILRLVHSSQWNNENTSLDDLIGYFSQEPLQFEPGGQTSYSNSGFILLGAIIEQVSNTSYANFMQQHIFQPLEMKHSFICQCTDNSLGDVFGTKGSIGSPANLNGAVAFSAGAMVSTVEDLAKWAQAINTNKLLSNHSWKVIFRRYKLTNKSESEFGYGWVIDSNPTPPSYWHNGALPGFSSDILIKPNENITIITLTNQYDMGLWAQLKMYLGGDHPTAKADTVRQQLLAIALAN